MAKRNTVSITLSRQRMEVLQELYNQYLHAFEPANEHEHLLCLHAQELKHKMQLLTQKQQAHYTLTLSPTQATALCQTGTLPGLPTHPYIAIILNGIKSKIGFAAA